MRVLRAIPELKEELRLNVGRKDQADVRTMLATGLVEPERLRSFFQAIEPELFRYPAIDARKFRSALEATIQ